MKPKKLKRNFKLNYNPTISWTLNDQTSSPFKYKQFQHNQLHYLQLDNPKNRNQIFIKNCPFKKKILGFEHSIILVPATIGHNTLISLISQHSTNLNIGGEGIQQNDATRNIILLYHNHTTITIDLNYNWTVN